FIREAADALQPFAFQQLGIVVGDQDELISAEPPLGLLVVQQVRVVGGIEGLDRLIELKPHRNWDGQRGQQQGHQKQREAAADQNVGNAGQRSVSHVGPLGGQVCAVVG